MRSNESSEDYLETILILGNRSSLVTALHDACRIEHIISEESFQALKRAVHELREQQESVKENAADQA